MRFFFPDEAEISTWVKAASVEQNDQNIQAARTLHFWYTLQHFIKQEQQLVPTQSADLDALLEDTHLRMSKTTFATKCGILQRCTLQALSYPACSGN